MCEGYTDFRRDGPEALGIDFAKPTSAVVDGLARHAPYHGDSTMSDPGNTVEAMQSILVKLEDVYNSQAALNQKMAVIQMAMEEIPNEELAEALNETYGNAQRNAELIKHAIHRYELVINARKMEEG